MQKPLWMWIAFLGLIFGLLLLDLGWFHHKNHRISFKSSLLMSLYYVIIASIFGLWLWYKLGITSFAEYMTGFFVEKTLALDNIFLISMIFSWLAIPLKYQHRVLFWGILGVLVLRAMMIALGVQIISNFAWVLNFFAGFMIFTGVKMLIFPAHHNTSIKDNLFLRWIKKHLRITNKLYHEKFLVYKQDNKDRTKKWFATPLLVALIMVEFIDLVFAVDSIPAIFLITQDPYIIYTSNIFAILGLRSLYFAVSSLIVKFYYIKYGLALVLIFIGAKVFIADLLGIDKIPPLISLGVTISILSMSIIYSIFKK